eukprot:2235118-Alexandrium_andersonii.AAC.1
MPHDLAIHDHLRVNAPASGPDLRMHVHVRAPQMHPSNNDVNSILHRRTLAWAIGSSSGHGGTPASHAKASGLGHPGPDRPKR